MVRRNSNWLIKERSSKLQVKLTSVSSDIFLGAELARKWRAWPIKGRDARVSEEKRCARETLEQIDENSDFWQIFGRKREKNAKKKKSSKMPIFCDFEQVERCVPSRDSELHPRKIKLSGVPRRRFYRSSVSSPFKIIFAQNILIIIESKVTDFLFIKIWHKIQIKEKNVERNFESKFPPTKKYTDVTFFSRKCDSFLVFYLPFHFKAKYKSLKNNLSLFVPSIQVIFLSHLCDRTHF